MLRCKGTIKYKHAHLRHCPAKESFLTGIVILKVEICGLSAHQIKFGVHTASVQRLHCVQNKGNAQIITIATNLNKPARRRKSSVGVPTTDFRNTYMSVCVTGCNTPGADSTNGGVDGTATDGLCMATAKQTEQTAKSQDDNKSDN